MGKSHTVPVDAEAAVALATELINLLGQNRVPPTMATAALMSALVMFAKANDRSFDEMLPDLRSIYDNVCNVEFYEPKRSH